MSKNSKTVTRLAAVLAVALPGFATAAPVLSDFSVFAGGSLVLGQGSTVASGMVGSNGLIDFNGGTNTQSVAGGGKLILGQNGVVNGSIDLDGMLDRRSSTTVTGSIQQYGVGVFSPLALPAPATIPAGSYADVNFGPISAYTLAAGTYYFHNWTGGNAKITFDVRGGDIALFFTGKVDMGSNIVTEVLGGDAGDVYTETLGQFHVESGSVWNGTVVSGSDIYFGQNTTANGALWAQDNITIRSESTVNFALADRITGADAVSSVPEPASLALVAGSLLAMAGVTRRRREAA